MPTIIKTKEDFEEAIKSENLTAVHFSADWAEQCGQINDLFDSLSKQSDLSDVAFVTCMAEDLSEVSLNYKIEAVPTVILFRAQKVLDRINGADTVKITEKVKHFNNSSDTGDRVLIKEHSLEDRLKELINKSKVMLFMKGDRWAPRCGFSKQIISILNDTGVTYETFDILTDEEVRQGLKTYSDWPTYPQLYVNGELIGGLDIVKEMQGSGELLSTLNS